MPLGPVAPRWELVVSSCLSGLSRIVSMVPALQAQVFWAELSCGILAREFFDRLSFGIVLAVSCRKIIYACFLHHGAKHCGCQLMYDRYGFLHEQKTLQIWKYWFEICIMIG